MKTLTSDEVNFLIYRYLVESAYTFGQESSIKKSQISGSNIPFGALISFLQKGIQYLKIEVGMHQEIKKSETTLNLLDLHLKRKFGKSSSETTMSKDNKNEGSGGKTESTSIIPKENHNNKAKQKAKQKIKTQPKLISNENVTILTGHSHEVFMCSWNPENPNVLASGSGDSTARIWKLPEGFCGKESSKLATKSHIELKHSTDNNARDVTTLDWSADGRLLATGSYDGKARIWSEDGDLIRTLEIHKGPIFSLKWNKRGDYLLSGSVDNTAVVWDVKTGEVKQLFKYHKDPTLDVDWKPGEDTFATCSTDRMIYVCKLGANKPLQTFQGHTDEVNAIRWNPCGSLLASCSDDNTAKIWKMKSNKCVYDFKEHQKEIYTLKWSPTGPGSRFSNKDLVLASASFDTTIKLWDVNVGKCLYSLNKHVDPVYSISFSPNGEYLASGSIDKHLLIWSVKDGSLVKMYKGNGRIFEVCWNVTGDKVAACFSDDYTVCVVDFRK